MKLALDLVVTTASIAAAIFWLWSALVKVPSPGMYWDSMPEDAPFIVAVRKAARLSATAATCAAVAALAAAPLPFI